MDFSGSPPSSPAKRSPKAKPSVSDENDRSPRFRQLGFCNMKKPFPKKNLPTDAASTVASPKNKVLTERNGSDDPTENIPISYSEPVKASPSTSGSKISPSSSADRFGKESLPPYEPFTNYLSPRPRFLRYKPDRQREMALRLEKEAEKGKEGLSSCRSRIKTGNISGEGGGSVSSCDIPKLEGEEDDGGSDDEVEEEGEEEEEQRSSICQELIKTLLLLVVLVFPASSYMSDMNSARSISHEVEVNGDGYWSIQNFTYEAALYGRDLALGCGSNFMSQAGEPGNDVDFLVKSAHSVNELEEQEEVFEFVLSTITDTEVGQNEEESAAVDVGEQVELNLEENYHTNERIFKPDDVSDQLIECFELRQSEKAQKFDYQIPTSLDMEAKRPSEQETSVQSEVEEEWGRTDEESGVNFPIGKPETDLNNEVLMVGIGTESSYDAIIGLLTVSLAILTAFLFGQFLKGKKSLANLVCSSPLKEQLCPEPVPEEKPEPQFQMKKKNCTKPLVLNSVINPSPVNAMGEASTQSNQSRAPKIELLGEFAVGELGSSYRSREMKSKLIGKVEESTNSASTDKSGIKDNTTQPAFSELSSSMNSPSHGSLTADINIKKPQEDGTEESRTAALTPARRSSRIQNTPVRRSSRIRSLVIQSP